MARYNLRLRHIDDPEDEPDYAIISENNKDMVIMGLLMALGSNGFYTTEGSDY